MRRNGLDLQRLERYKVFVSKVLSDFAFQWRHILLSRYNNSTFRRLACAIIKITTLDFNVVEPALPHWGTGRFLVQLHNLPGWDPVYGHIFRVGETSLVVIQHIPHAIALIRMDFAKQNRPALGNNYSTSPNKSSTYFILSVKEIILCRISSSSARYTKPERLLDGTDAPSDEAIKLLIEATQTSVPRTRIHDLPIELQDMILDKVSMGPIKRARVGCILNIGSVFNWKCGGRDIEREERSRIKVLQTPVESRIWFGNKFSGVAYK